MLYLKVAATQQLLVLYEADASSDYPTVIEHTAALSKVGKDIANIANSHNQLPKNPLLMSHFTGFFRTRPSQCSAATTGTWLRRRTTSSPEHCV